METLEQQLAGLSPERRRLVELWLRKEQAKEQAAAESSATQQIPRRRPTDSSPLSCAQQRLWLLQQLEPDSPAYNLRTIIRLLGPLDVAVLQRSLDEIVRRHEVLRSSFAALDGQPQQQIAADWHVPLEMIELQALPAAEREAQIQRLALLETEQPFDLEHGPIWRARLLRLGRDEHVLFLTMHHIISDGWSQGVQLRELMALYAAFVQGRASPLPELPIQYADYALWQRQSFQRAALHQQLNYWKAQLGLASHRLELPTDRPRPPMATHHGSWDYFTMPGSLLEQLKALSRREGVTLFMVLLATWNLLLYRYSGQTDIVIGTPVAGRNRSELEGLIGCFVNMLALRLNLGGNPSFRELLQRMRKVTLGAYSNQDLPFEKLVEELQLDRDMSRNPIFQLMFVLQNAPMPELQSHGLKFQPLEVNSTTSILDLSLYVREHNQELLIRAEYNTDLFDASTIQRMLSQFHILLEQVVAEPLTPLASFSLLNEQQRQQLPGLQEELALLWAQTLGLAQVPTDANFFELGVEPSRASQLTARIRDTFQVELPVRSLFDRPTIPALAELLLARESKPGQTDKIVRMLRRIRQMPAADRQQILAQKRQARSQH